MATTVNARKAAPGKALQASPKANAVVAAPAAPTYWEEARTALMKKDRVLRRLIPKYPGLTMTSRGDPFTTLARSIVGQQISVKAAQSVWERMIQAVPDFTPAKATRAGAKKLMPCGLSQRKCEYILDLAGHFKAGSLEPKEWDAMPDEDLITLLVEVRGIGRWTAEMFLMFNQLRPNVLPLDDVGLQKAVSVHYFSGEPVTRSDLREVAVNWQPWASVATWYMWRSLDPIPVEY